MLELSVVAVSTPGRSSRASGLALWGDGQPPLVLTVADLDLNFSTVEVTYDLESGAAVLPATPAGSVKVGAADKAFMALRARGWRCGAGTVSSGFRAQLLRTEPPPGRCRLRWPMSLETPDEAWVGEPLSVRAAPFGVIPSASTSSLLQVETRGVVTNVSSPAGLLLLDARCILGAAGGAVTLTRSSGPVAVAALLSQMRSATNESVAVSIAVPLTYVFEALLGHPECSLALERFPLDALPRALPSPAPLATAAVEDVRRGVVLLWLETTGSWASGVVISSDGYILTCAHLLTGNSWMELAPGEPEPKVPSSRYKPALPKTCRGRAQALGADGRFIEINFDAEVLHIFDGYLDVALLKAKPVRGNKLSPSYLPLPWRRSQGLETRQVWAVGYGLFGPGSPWRLPSVTVGHVTKVASGEKSQRAALIQSTAAVHRGCSGGALVDTATGSLVGLVTTNVRHQDGAVMPHVNFSLPVDLLDPLAEFLANVNKGTASVEKLAQAWKACAADEEERSLWRLEPEALDLPSPVERRKRAALARFNRLAEDAAQAEAAAETEGALTSEATVFLRTSTPHLVDVSQLHHAQPGGKALGRLANLLGSPAVVKSKL